MSCATTSSAAAQDGKQRVYSHSLLGKSAPASTLHSFERHSWPSLSNIGSTGQILKENPYEEARYRRCTVIASASPVLADAFPNVYLSR